MDPFWKFIADCSASTSVLANLEPLLATAFGVNIAYLSLERFRYRSKIRDHAKENLGRFKDGGSGVPSRLISNKWYKEVSRLASLGNNDSDLPKPKSGPATLPDGRWPAVYAYLFEHHRDRKLCILLAFVLSALLLTGVAHQVFVLKPVRCFFTPSYIPITFWFGVVAAILPTIFMHLGSKVVRWGTHYSTECVDNLLEVMQDDVKSASLKTDKTK